jgi:hypothetical protein
VIPIGAQPHELVGGGEKLIEQPLRFVADDATRRGARHDLVQNRKRPRQGVAHIARDAREPRLQHQDADARAK